MTSDQCPVTSVSTLRGLAVPLVLLVAACVSLSRADNEERRDAGLAPVVSASPTDRILLVTGPLEGNLEPCNCTEGMLGGIPRRASLVARFGGKLPILDLGDLDKPSETSDALMELRERAALEALGAVGTASLHAIALGCTDARLGLDRLGKISSEAAPGTLWLCANAKGAPAFVKKTIEHEGVTITAVLDPEKSGPVQGCELGSPADAIREIARAGKPLVVLWHGEPAAAVKALEDVNGVSIIICGHAHDPLPPSKLRSGATLLVLEPNGQRLHAIALSATGFHAEAAHPLDGLLPDGQASRAALDRFYEEATRIAPELPRRKVDGEGGRFVGSESCKECHKEAYEIWAKTGHSRALARLEEKEKKRSGLAECVICHVTGYGLETGWAPGKGPSELASVGCESCHGVGSNHVERAWKNDDVTGFGRPPGKGQERWRARCMLCHDPRNSPSFELGPYLEKIKHWK